MYSFISSINSFRKFKYASKNEIIDFIVNRSLIEKSYQNNDFTIKGKLKLLIMNSGTNSLTQPINNFILSIPNNENGKFI